MKKLTRMIAAASVLGLILAGCGEKDNNDNPKVEINIKDYGTIKAELDPKQAPITVENFISLAEEGFYDGLTFHRIMDGFMMQGGDPLGNGTGGSEETIKGEFSQNGVDNTISHKKGTLSMARSQAPDSASSQFFIVDEDSTFLDGQYAAFGHVTEGIEIVDKICSEANRSQAPDSASSQFFIVDEDSTFLDGQYAAFGHVTEGIEIVDKICSEAKVIDDNGTVLPEDQPVIESIKVVK